MPSTFWKLKLKVLWKFAHFDLRIKTFHSLLISIVYFGVLSLLSVVFVPNVVVLLFIYLPIHICQVRHPNSALRFSVGLRLAAGAAQARTRNIAFFVAPCGSHFSRSAAVISFASAGEHLSGTLSVWSH